MLAVLGVFIVGVRVYHCTRCDKRDGKEVEGVGRVGDRHSTKIDGNVIDTPLYCAASNWQGAFASVDRMCLESLDGLLPVLALTVNSRLLEHGTTTKDPLREHSATKINILSIGSG